MVGIVIPSPSAIHPSIGLDTVDGDCSALGVCGTGFHYWVSI